MRLLSNVLLMGVRDASLIRTGLKSLTESTVNLRMMQGYRLDLSAEAIGQRVRADIAALVTDAEPQMLLIQENKEVLLDLCTMMQKAANSQAKQVMHREKTMVKPLDEGCRMMTPIFNSKVRAGSCRASTL